MPGMEITWSFSRDGKTFDHHRTRFKRAEAVLMRGALAHTDS